MPSEAAAPALGPATLSAAMLATWPPEEVRRLGPWTLRRGRGGGNRVSAATLDGPHGDIAEAEAAMRDWGQPPLFMVRSGEDRLDAALEARGYPIRDPVLLLGAAPGRLEPHERSERVLVGPGPLAAMREIWAEGGIDGPRLAVMQRVAGPRAFLLGRLGDRPAASAFAAVHDGIAMLHAVEVAPFARRHGIGSMLARAAAGWARDEGAGLIALAVTRDNAEARALYQRIGMTDLGAYHYRAAP